VTEPRDRPSRSPLRSRLLIRVVTSTFIVGFLFVGIFPVRAIVEQRAEIAAAERELAEVEAANDELEDRIEALGTDAEIERLARERHNLGRPGEEVYAVLPAPPAPPAVPDAWPFRGLAEAVDPDDG
jgi:cell division protein FtsB